MATCMVDVEPRSIAGVVCGRRLVVDLCPVHGLIREPDIRDRSVIEQDIIMERIKQLVSEGNLARAAGYALGAIGAIAEFSVFPEECASGMARIRSIWDLIGGGLNGQGPQQED